MFLAVPKTLQTRRTISAGVSLKRSPSSPAQDLLGQASGLDLLAPDEGVEVGDEDRRGLEAVELLGRDEVHRPVVVVRVVGQQHAEAVADGDAGRDDEEARAEPLVVRVGQLVEGLPGDEHRHHHRLAGPGRHLEGQPREAVVQAGVLARMTLRALVSPMRVCGLGQVDRRLDGLDLAEEEAAARGPRRASRPAARGWRRGVRVALECASGPPPGGSR